LWPLKGVLVQSPPAHCNAGRLIASGVRLAAAAFGAFAGAWINARIQARKTALAEINSINAALALSFSICNRAVSLKKQHVSQMVMRYERAQRDYAQQLVKLRTKPRTDCF
jgi:hypothetical protein